MTIAKGKDEPSSPAKGANVEKSGQTAPSGEQEPDFPLAILAELDEMLGRTKWVVPVQPGAQLEVLIRASIDLCQNGLDVKSSPCQRFFRESLTNCFQKILNDDAVSTWKLEIQRHILENTMDLVELCVVKLRQNWFVLLDLLCLAFSPQAKFHNFNYARPSESAPAGQVATVDPVYACVDPRLQRGYLVDLLNHFGKLGGFKILREHLCDGDEPLSVSVICANLKPFGQCAEALTQECVETYFVPVMDKAVEYLESLSDADLKKESKNEAKSDVFPVIIRCLRKLAFRVPSRKSMVEDLEKLQLQLYLRLLQVSSFNGKMNAINEINRLIANVSYCRHMDDSEWLTSERLATWIYENKVLSIVLRENLHQPQYVEKLEKLVRFIIKEKTLSLSDLDSIWVAQAGKHEAIVKNIHDLLARLAWDFSAEQLDHLFRCFQRSWASASKKGREKLLELIRRLAEDDKDGMMAEKVLKLLWDLAHSEDCPPDIMEQALNALAKILDYSCSQDMDQLKSQWLVECVNELRDVHWVLPALKLIKDISSVFPVAPAGVTQTRSMRQVIYRRELLAKLETEHRLLLLVCTSLCQYMESVRKLDIDRAEADVEVFSPDGRYSHAQHLQERLHFIRFILREGQLWLLIECAEQIWKCLAEHAVFPADREICFRWFSQLLGDEPDLEPDHTLVFMEANVLKLDPTVLTENGLRCFERFFRSVNIHLRKLSIHRRRGFVTEDLDLVGLDYTWQCVMRGSDEVASQAIELMKESMTNLSLTLRQDLGTTHKVFLQTCMERLQINYDSLLVLRSGQSTKEEEMIHVMRMVRCLHLLKEFVAECDNGHAEERVLVPHGKSIRGRQLTVIVRFPASLHGRAVDDLEVLTHANESLGALRRRAVQRLKALGLTYPIDLFCGADPLLPGDDKKLVSSIPLRDKSVLTAKPCQQGVGPTINTNGMASSPDSSSESSAGSTSGLCDGPNPAAELQLPGVAISRDATLCGFLLQLGDLGITANYPTLRDAVRNLMRLMPSDENRVKQIRLLCESGAKQSKSGASGKIGKSDSDLGFSPALEALFFRDVGPARALYNVEILVSLMMPAHFTSEKDVFDFQVCFVECGGIPCVFRMIQGINFMEQADNATRRSAQQCLLKLAKILLVVVGFSWANKMAVPQTKSPTQSASQLEPNKLEILARALDHVPSVQSDLWLKSCAQRLAAHCSQMSFPGPDNGTIEAVLRLAWSSACGASHIATKPAMNIHAEFQQLSVGTRLPELEDVNISREGLEILALCAALDPSLMNIVVKSTDWHNFISDILLLCRHRSVRLTASEQLHLMATHCSANHEPLKFFINYLFELVMTTAKNHAQFSHQCFHLLCRLLNHAGTEQLSVTSIQERLTDELAWLADMKTSCKTGGNCSNSSPSAGLLEGHLNITRELIALQSSAEKHRIGSKTPGDGLINTLINDFLFASSRLVMEVENDQEKNSFSLDQARSVCASSLSQTAAYDLLVALCTGCVPNLRHVCDQLTDLFYRESLPLTEWEYQPPVGPRPNGGFVGLKNAGATCYMNSILQTLYMTPPIRDTILAASNAGWDEEDEVACRSNKDAQTPTESGGIPCAIGRLDLSEKEKEKEKSTAPLSPADQRKDYNLCVLRQLQHIFGHLLGSQLQFHTPNGFWKTFKLWGESVNLREQHDALEFFNSLVDSVDEALKMLGEKPPVVNTLGGSFADQKICRGCPHRYTREEPFTSLNIDVRNHQHLLESLDQYVKGDLLEGANAYHCEKCDKKVDTVKRLCIRKLPRVLVFQLKRFDYDWERECAVKFNDYFEFPQEMDMEPFTVQGLAKVEGEVIETVDEEHPSQPLCTRYRLAAIIVHSGQASGGHYYSYIIQRPAEGDTPRWYKFDDNEVTECKMDEEEMKAQCFGGDYMTDVYDHISKRMQYRRQKRWWNAYILFYERLDEPVMLQSTWTTPSVAMEKCLTPKHICTSVQQENLHFSHLRAHFCAEYFTFVRKLVVANTPPPPEKNKDLALTDEQEEAAMLCLTLISKFLFSVGFRSKKTLRGQAIDWYDALVGLLRLNKKMRFWFASNVFFQHPDCFSSFLLECSAADVRGAVVKLLVILADLSVDDGPFSLPKASADTSEAALELLQAAAVVPGATLTEYILRMVVNMLRRHVPDHSKHLQQYFLFFHWYASMGANECKKLVRLNVPHQLVLAALDLPHKYQFVDLSKLHIVVSQLLRCYDMTKVQRSMVSGAAPLPYPDTRIAVVEDLPHLVEEEVLNKSRYLKKILEDVPSSEETAELIQYLCWENPSYSHTVLVELLWQVACVYTYELRPYLDLLRFVLMIPDSWQHPRITNTLKGMSDDREGILDIIQRSKSHYQKRGYQCIKFLVKLFSSCSMAQRLLMQDTDIQRLWRNAVEWLHDELQRKFGGTVYQQWSPVAQSNETSNGYFLERSDSARDVLSKACELVPDEIVDDEDMVIGNEGECDEPLAQPIIVTDGENSGPHISEGDDNGNHSDAVELFDNKAPLEH